MQLKILAFTFVLLAIPPATAVAEKKQFFAGLEAAGGVATGSSGTINGGAAFAGGGIVNNIKFGETVGIGGHIGYQMSEASSVFLSYQYIKGDVSWDADFPLIGEASAFKGSAISNTIMGNLAYEFPLSNTLSITTSASAGAGFNALSGLVETDKQSHIFLSKVKGHTTIHPIAQIGTGIRYNIAPNAALGINASVAYSGGFETGKTRKGNLGVTSISPYEIEDVWRGNLGVSFTFAF